jgi:hypothetical protein
MSIVDEPTDTEIDTFLLNNEWNDHNERLIVTIGESAAGYKWMHQQCYQRYNLLNKFVNILLILLTTGLSAQISISRSDECSCDLSQQILTYLITGLTILSNFLNFEKQSLKHLTAETSYSELYHDIQQQMCYFRKDRPPASKYVNSKFKKFDHLTLINPDIDKYILSKFERKYNTTNKKHFNTPVSKIEIINERLQSQTASHPVSTIDKPELNTTDYVVINMENGPTVPISNNTKKSNLYCMTSITNENFRIQGDIDSFNTKEYLKRKAIQEHIKYEINRNENV